MRVTLFHNGRRYVIDAPDNSRVSLPARPDSEQGLIVEHDGQTFPLLPWMVVHCARKGEHGLTIVSEEIVGPGGDE